MTILGTTKDDIDRAWIDYYSIGHIVFGFISYLICYLITFFAKIYHYREYSLVSTIIIGVVWELIENTILIHTRLKYEHREDSLQNSHFDVLFVFAGGIVCLSFTYLTPVIFIISVVVFLVSAIFLLDLFGTLTHSEKQVKQ